MQRKTFIAAAATAAALGAAACAKSGAAPLEFVERAGEFDAAAFEKRFAAGAQVRQLWDVSGFDPHVFGSVKNALNGYQFGFGISPQKIATAICLHGDAIAFAYADEMWQKYNVGAALDYKDPSGALVTHNVFFAARSSAQRDADPDDAKGMYQDPSIEALHRRGTVVLVCHTGAAEQAQHIFARGAAPGAAGPQDVFADLLAHLIPGALVVPSAQSAIGILQNRHGFAYTGS